MQKERQIKAVVRKVSFAEAEEADNIYWANANEQERLNTLFDLRLMLVDDSKSGQNKISKVVFKRSLYEE
jgi:hypothetical protein